MRKSPSISGKSTPLHQSAPKYTLVESPACNVLLNRAITGPARSLIQASMTSGSWNKLNSALHCFSQFESERNQISPWPLSDKVLCDFVSWVVLSRGLKTSTAKTYLSNLSTIHELKGLGRVNCFQVLTKRVLKGAKNIAFYKSMASESTRVMTLPLLKLLGHEISRSSWSKINKQVFWSACTTAFFGSFRFGEIPSQTEWTFNSHETLLWSDVSFSHDSVLSLSLSVERITPELASSSKTLLFVACVCSKPSK